MTQPDEKNTFAIMEILADVSPRAAITKAFSALYTELKTAEQILGLEHIPNKVGRRVITKLVKEGEIEKGAINLYLDLRKIRNEAAHESDFEITRDAVDRYFNLIIPFIKRIANIMAKIKGQNIQPQD